MDEDYLNYNYRIIFDRMPGGPGEEARFIEVENVHGRSVRGEWFVEGDIVVLVIPPHIALLDERDALQEEVRVLANEVADLRGTTAYLKTKLDSTEFELFAKGLGERG